MARNGVERVLWDDVAAQVAASEEWAALEAALMAQRGGGPAVAALAASALVGGPGSRSLIHVLMEITWEKLHTGAWHAVALPWRDAYSLACLLAAAAAMASEDTRNSADTTLESIAAAKAALRHLDMAALMGGPALRPLINALADDLVQRLGGGHDGLNNIDAPLEEGEVVLGAAPAVAVPLPSGALGPAGARIPVVSLPSLEAFAAEFMGKTPVVIEGALEGWPALRRWQRPSYWRAVAGPRTVPVEVGRSYVEEGWGQSLITFSKLLDTHMLGESPAAAAPTPPVYLAQHDLLAQIPALARDVHEPEYCALGAAVRAVNVWIGPPGTVTPAHIDPSQNLLCQVVGRKYVRLYAPEHAEAMYSGEGGSLTANTGGVDIDAPDTERHPLFAAAPFLDCVLEAGQALYIPKRWWHYVKSLSTSASVNFWWE